VEIFPVDPHPDIEVNVSSEFSNLILQSVSGLERRYSRWDVPRYSWRLRYLVTRDGRDRILKFFEDRFGSLETFWFMSFRRDALLSINAPAGTYYLVIPSDQAYLFTAESGRHGNFLYTWSVGETHQIVSTSLVVIGGVIYYRLELDRPLESDHPSGSEIDVCYKARFEGMLEQVSSIHRVYQFEARIVEVL